LNLSELGVTGLWQPDESIGGKWLLIVLHGRGDSAEGFEGLRAALRLPGLSTLLINAPDPYYTGFSWYDLPPNQRPGIERSRELLGRVLAGIHRQGYPPERCILFGFSQGCLMTLEFGARYSERLAGYVGVSGYCYDENLLSREASTAAREGDWLITHGTRDDVLPVERTRAQMQCLIEQGFNLEYREYPKGHTLDPHAELSYIREWLRQRISASGA
jgi:phospholipase/carboxylesterase